MTLAGMLLGAALAGAAPGPAAPGDSLPFRLRLAEGLAASADARGALVEPDGIAVDAFGRLYVADAGLNRLERYDARGVWLGESGSLGSDPGQMRRPGAVALLGTLSVVVLDLENRRVVTYDLFGRQQGTLIDLLSSDVTSAVDRVDPVTIATDRGGALHLADADRDRVLTFDVSGRFVRTVGGLGSRPGSFRGLRGLAATARGELVSAERTNARVQRLDAGGRVIASWPLDVKPGRGSLPVAVDDSLRIAVADETGGRLWLFDGSGRLLGAAAGLAGPRALAFARDGTLLVAESRGGRVRRVVIEPQGARPPGGED